MQVFLFKFPDSEDTLGYIAQTLGMDLLMKHYAQTWIQRTSILIHFVLLWMNGNISWFPSKIIIKDAKQVQRFIEVMFFLAIIRRREIAQESNKMPKTWEKIKENIKAVSWVRMGLQHVACGIEGHFIWSRLEAR